MNIVHPCAYNETTSVAIGTVFFLNGKISALQAIGDSVDRTGALDHQAVSEERSRWLRVKVVPTNLAAVTTSDTRDVTSGESVSVMFNARGSMTGSKTPIKTHHVTG